MSTKITYNGKTTELADGYKAVWDCKDYKMASDVVIESEGEVIPEISEVDDFRVFAGGADEGSLEIGYSVSQKVALPAANPALLTTIDDTNFIASNIKKGVSVFGLTGAYEGDGGKPIEVNTLDNSLLTAENDGKVYKCEDKLYQVNKVKSLKGLTIKFNEHITPCTVIGEDDVFECSGTMADTNANGYLVGENRSITELSKKAIADSYMTSDAMSIVITVGYDEEKAGAYDTYYSPNDNNAEGAGWYQLEYEMGNEWKMYFHPPVITDFDCPTLNENPEFIEWVFANGKVYSNIETVSNIKSFKFTQPCNVDFRLIYAFMCEMADNQSENFKSVFDGQYTALFTINGELITKTFSRFGSDNDFCAYDEGTVAAYFSDGENVLNFEFIIEDNLGLYNVKYNGTATDDGVTFTKFDCELNAHPQFFFWIFLFATVSGEYPNGLYFVEYVPKTDDSGEWINDGNTHLWISLPEGRTSPMLCVCPNGTVTVDWGDGTTPDVLTGTSTSELKATPNHNYAEAGDYVITLTVDGEMGFVDYTNYGVSILSFIPDYDGLNNIYRTAIHKIEIGNGALITDSAFQECYGLKSVNIGYGVTTIGYQAFYGCYALESVIISDSVTTIDWGAFMYCESLTNVIIGENVTTLNESVFSSCYALSNIVIPNSVTSMGGTVFDSCNITYITIPNSMTTINGLAFASIYGIAVYDFTKYNTIPTIENSDYLSMPDGCQIRVPMALEAQWKTADGWSEWADFIVGV